MVFERFLLPIVLKAYFKNKEAKASERSENERKYYALPVVLSKLIFWVK